jgi:hypothetical protein
MLEAPGAWVKKLAHWLPAHRDRLTLLMASAIAASLWGKYTPEYQDEEAESRPKDPETVKAAANRELDVFARKADAAISAYRSKNKRR